MATLSAGIGPDGGIHGAENVHGTALVPELGASEGVSARNCGAALQAQIQIGAQAGDLPHQTRTAHPI